MASVHAAFGLSLGKLRRQVQVMEKIVWFRWPKNHTVTQRFRRWDRVLQRLQYTLDEQVGEDGIYICLDYAVLQQSASHIRTVFETYTVHHRTRTLSRAFHTEERGVFVELIEYNDQVLHTAKQMWDDRVIKRNNNRTALRQWNEMTVLMRTLL